MRCSDCKMCRQSVVNEHSLWPLSALCLAFVAFSLSHAKSSTDSNGAVVLHTEWRRPIRVDSSRSARHCRRSTRASLVTHMWSPSLLSEDFAHSHWAHIIILFAGCQMSIRYKKAHIYSPVAVDIYVSTLVIITVDHLFLTVPFCFLIYANAPLSFFNDHCTSSLH